MVIRCDQCDTRFRLDEARIPESGARVRCSKCQHSFFVRRDADSEPAAPTTAEESVAPSDAAAPPAPAPQVPAPAAPEDTAASTAAPPAAAQPKAEPESQAADSVAPVAAALGAPTGAARAPEAGDGEWEFGETDVRFGPDAQEPEPPEDEDPLAVAAAAADHEESAPRASASGSAAARDALASSQTSAEDAPQPEGVVPIGDSIDGLDAAAQSASVFDPLDLRGDPPDALAPEAPDPVPSPNEDSLAAVGDPSSWDLSSDNLESPPTPAEPDPPQPPPPPTAPEPLFADATGEGQGDLFPILGGEEFQYLEGDEREPAERAPSDWVAAAVGWPLVFMLAVFTAWSSLRPPPVAGAPHSLPIGSGFEVTGLRSRILENAIGGSLLVVTGELRNPTGRRGALLSTLAVRLLDPSGGTIEGTRALASANLDERSLRLTDPAILRAEQQRGARELALRELRPGETVHFDAVFDQLPARAVRFSFVEERVPLHVLGAFHETESEGAVPTATGVAPRTPPSTAPLSGE